MNELEWIAYKHRNKFVLIDKCIMDYKGSIIVINLNNFILDKFLLTSYVLVASSI